MTAPLNIGFYERTESDLRRNEVRFFTEDFIGLDGPKVKLDVRATLRKARRNNCEPRLAVTIAMLDAAYRPRYDAITWGAWATQTTYSLDNGRTNL